MVRRITARWLNGGGREPALTLELHIPVQPYQPNARQSGWTPSQLTQIAELVARTAEAAVKAVEETGL